MATNVFSARISLDIQSQEILSSGIKAGVIPSKFAISTDLDNGTSDGKIDLAFSQSVSGISASTTSSYDLVGNMKDLSGNTMSFAEVVLIAVRNNNTTALQYLQVGPHATNGFGKLASSRGFFGATADVTNGSGVCIAPGSWYVAYNLDGVPAAAASTDILALVTSAVVATNSWDILILGRSA